MELNLTKKQYEAMVKSLYLSSAVLRSYRPDPELEKQEVEEELEQEKLLEQLLKQAPQYDLAHWIRTDEDGKTVLTIEKEFSIYEQLEQFEALSFWNNLAENLAQRDLEEVLSDDDLMAMDLGEELEKELKIQEKYETEFIENGLQNLRLINPEHN